MGNDLKYYATLKFLSNLRDKSRSGEDIWTILSLEVKKFREELRPVAIGYLTFIKCVDDDEDSRIYSSHRPESSSDIIE